MILWRSESFWIRSYHNKERAYADLLFREDRETHLCYPSFRKIGVHTGMSPNTVRKYITQLEDKYLIETLPTTVWTLDGTARNGTLLHTILPIYEAVNYHLRACVRF